MKRYISLLIMCTVVSCCTARKNKYLSNDLLEVWNQKTLNSINDQLSSTDDKSLKKRLQNHLDAAKLLLNSGTEIDGVGVDGSVRSKFLKVISLDMDHRSFFVLEKIENGEKIEIENMLIVNVPTGSQITSYRYYADKWHKLKDTTINKIDFHAELMKKSPLNDLNDNGMLHVILSEFSGTNVTSRFYQGDMISKQDVFFELLNP